MSFQQGEFVVRQKVALYHEPAVRANKTLLPNGTRLFVDEQVADADGSGWWKVHDAAQKTGFIFNSTQGYFISSGASDQAGQLGAVEVDPALIGIGGWLILPAIGLALGPLALLAGVLEIGSAITTSSSIAPFMLASQIGLLAGALVAAVQFFRKKKAAPMSVIFLLMAQAAVLLLLAVIAPNDDVRFGAIVSLVKSAVPAAIWIPYFLKSRRVKATFVR